MVAAFHGGVCVGVSLLRKHHVTGLKNIGIGRDSARVGVEIWCLGFDANLEHALHGILVIVDDEQVRTPDVTPDIHALVDPTDDGSVLAVGVGDGCQRILGTFTTLVDDSRAVRRDDLALDFLLLGTVRLGFVKDDGVSLVGSGIGAQGPAGVHGKGVTPALDTLIEGAGEPGRQGQRGVLVAEEDRFVGDNDTVHGCGRSALSHAVILVIVVHKQNVAGVDVEHPLEIKLHPLQASFVDSKHVLGNGDAEAFAVIDAGGIHISSSRTLLFGCMCTRCPCDAAGFPSIPPRRAQTMGFSVTTGLSAVAFLET